MIGRNPLWVAKQHGHSIPTMLRVYAAWTEGATDSDIKAIQRAMTSKQQGSSFATGFATSQGRERGKCSNGRVKSGGERGIRTRGSDSVDQQ